ncbi:hypothetical protein AKO1_014942 [Acrasis kona]|uniref:Uncharacterized protein n=1 Tax=Acrasis kona TaxID=1008807 RepID=A0AAW2YZX5_9EUKA
MTTKQSIRDIRDEALLNEKTKSEIESDNRLQQSRVLSQADPKPRHVVPKPTFVAESTMTSNVKLPRQKSAPDKFQLPSIQKKLTQKQEASKSTLNKNTTSNKNTRAKNPSMPSILPKNDPLDDILKKARMIRQREEDKKTIFDRVIEEERDNVTPKPPPAPIQTIASPQDECVSPVYSNVVVAQTKEVDRAPKVISFKSKLKRHHKLLKTQNKKLSCLDSVTASFGQYDMTTIHDVSVLLAVKQSMNMMMSDLDDIFSQNATNEYNKTQAKQFLSIYKHNDIISNMLINVEQETETTLEEYEADCMNTLTTTNNINNDTYKQYKQTPQAYVSRWLPTRIKSGIAESESNVFDVIFPRGLKMDSSVGQLCLYYNKKEQIHEICHLRHEIQRLILQTHIKTSLMKEITPLLNKMSTLVTHHDESLKDFIYLWRLLHFVVTDGKRLIVFTRKESNH